jgi:hypothetical protein
MEGDKDTAKEVSRQKDLELIRAWAMSLKPDEGKSTHWWYGDLDKEAKGAFDRCAHSTQVLQPITLHNSYGWTTTRLSSHDTAVREVPNPPHL